MVQGSCKRIDVKSMSIVFSIFYERFVVQNIFERKVDVLWFKDLVQNSCQFDVNSISKIL